jgi:hypothetical protein
MLFIKTLGAQDLIAYYENNKWGYVNKNGEKIILAQFAEGGIFVNDLAPVRIGGYYGYIGPDGKQKIKAEYDYARAFDNGFALVNVKAKDKIIDTEGKIVFEPGAKDIIMPPKNKLLKVIKDSTKSGLYDLGEKRWILQPIYGRISEIALGHFLVSAYEEKDERDYSLDKSAICKSDGKFLTDFDFIKEAQMMEDGNFLIETYKNELTKIKIVDKDGHMVAEFRSGENDKYYYDKTFRDGLIMKTHYGKNNEYVSYHDKTGKAIIDDRKFKDGEPFLNGRTLVKDKKDKWGVIDLKGQYVSDERFEYYGEGFETVGSGIDICIVRSEHFDYGVMLNTGKYLIKPKCHSITILDYSRGLLLAKMDDTIQQRKINVENASDLLSKLKGEHNGKEDTLTTEMAKASKAEGEKSLDELFEGEDYNELCGIIGLKGEIIIPFKYYDLALTEHEDVLYFRDKKTEGFIKMSGEIIWQHSLGRERKNKLDTLDIPYMERGYCFAASNGIYRMGLGGWGGSDNKAQKINSIKADYTKGKLSLWIDTLSTDTFYSEFLGRRMFLCNDTKDTVIFDAQDSRLYITMQAFDTEGNWKDIEYSPNSWCGNSYHEVGLLPSQYWKFTIPVYKGEIPVKLRMKLIVERKWDQENKKYKTENIIYSNTFSGKINPGQFWRKKGHSATGIMDSYNE